MASATPRSKCFNARFASKFEWAAMRELETEPSFAELRKDPRFQALMRQVRSHLDEQRRELDRLRAEGVVPDRSGKPGAPAETPGSDGRLVRLPRLVRR